MTDRSTTGRSTRTAAAGLAAALLLSACGGNAEGDGEREGGEVTFLLETLDPGWIANQTSIDNYVANVWGQITDKLVYADAEGNIHPWIAESWEESDDGLEYTLHLKEGVTFSDGTPLDAEAVAANIDYWAEGNPDEGIQRVGLFPASTYDYSEAVDEHTVRVVLTEPTLGFIPTLGYHGSILLSPETLEAPASEQADLSDTVGSGAFTVESWTEGSEVVLSRRDDYDWGPEVLGHEGAASLETITFSVVPEATLRSSAVQSDQAEIGFNVPVQELETLQSAGLDVDAPRYLGFTNGYRVNTAAEPFDDLNVRKALQHGIDGEEILNTVYTDEWEPAESFFQSNVSEAEDHSELFAYEPEESEELLEDSGWEEGADGVREKDGERLELTLYTSPWLHTSAPQTEIIAQNLEEIGFDVEIEQYDLSTYQDRVQHNPEVPLQQQTRSFIDAGTVAQVITGQDDGEDWFSVGEEDETLNRLADEIAEADDLDERAELIAELDEYVLDQAYYIPFTQLVQRVYVRTPELQNVVYDGLAIPNYWAAYLEE